MLLDIYRTLH